jgi:hypothetical protein
MNKEMSFIKMMPAVGTRPTSISYKRNQSNRTLLPVSESLDRLFPHPSALEVASIGATRRTNASARVGSGRLGVRAYRGVKPPARAFVIASSWNCRDLGRALASGTFKVAGAGRASLRHRWARWMGRTLTHHLLAHRPRKCHFSLHFLSSLFEGTFLGLLLLKFSG